MDNSSVPNTTSAFHGPPPDTSYAGWIMVPLTSTTLIANLLLITVYIRSPDIHTPFAVYIISLASGDLLQSCTSCIHSTVTLLGIRWPFGRSLCIVALYLSWALVSFCCHIHVLICGNRLWAVVWPNHYRLYHSRKVAVLCVVGLVVYINMWVLPGFAIHLLYYSAGDGAFICLPDYPQQHVWAHTAGSALYFAPEVLLVLMYPVIFFKVNRKLSNKVHTGSVHGHPASGSYSKKSTANQNSGITKESMVMNKSGVDPDTGNSGRRRRPIRPRRHFAVLTALVMGAVLCWTPVNVAYLLMMFQSPIGYQLLAPCTLVFYLDGLLNPLIYPFASKEWRDGFAKLFKR